MKKGLSILMLFVISGVASAHGYYYSYGYDPVDAWANQEVAAINADERAEVMHELREGDFGEAQEIIQQDEALKREIRREEAIYDAGRYRGQFDYGYGYYDW